MASTHIMFRIIYNFIYLVLCLLTVALLLVVPVDIAIQAVLGSRTWINVVILSIVYALALLVILFVYATRLYITRMAIAAIPKAWVPIEKGDVPKEVRNMIAISLSNSAAIALAARPKITPQEEPTLVTSQETESGVQGNDISEKASAARNSFQVLRGKKKTIEEEMGIALPPTYPVWGHIEHNGWGSPNLPDLHNLQYSTVLVELPNLIEAKAITQAPPAPDSLAEAPTLDLEAVELLERPQHMTMRDYVGHLISIGVLSTSETTTAFLDIYEQARFSTRSMSENTFRQLMHLFAELLRGMQPLDMSVLYASTEGGDDGYSMDYQDSEDGHIDDDAPQDTSPSTPARSLARTRSYQSSLRSYASSQRLHLQTSYSNNSSHNNAGNNNTSWQRQIHNHNQIHMQSSTQHFRTAPTTPRSKFGRTYSSSSPSTRSARSFAQSRRPYPASQMSSDSLGSGSQQGSVIRLARDGDEGDLPYVLTHTRSY